MRSIFNSALAPVTPGPSGSNTCAPVRIGLICRALLGGTPERVIIEYDASGAYPSALFAMKSDVAFINGLLGRDQDHPDFDSAYDAAVSAGLTVKFSEVRDIKAWGRETVRLRMTDTYRHELDVIAESLGGGAVKIHRIADCDAAILGDCWELVLFARGDEAEGLRAELASDVCPLNGIDISVGRAFAIVRARSPRPFPAELIRRLEVGGRADAVRVVAPVHPVVIDESRRPPFDTPEGLIAYCEERGVTPGQAALDYEAAISGMSEDEVRAFCAKLIDVMRASDEAGRAGAGEIMGGGGAPLVSPRAASMRGRMGEGKAPGLGLLDAAIPSALGIMEHGGTGGRILCAPAGGAAGIVPGLLLTSANEHGASPRELEDALMCAGLFGALMMTDGNGFNGASQGCLVEIGCGAAMAAAGLVQLAGGSAAQAEAAASLCLQSFTGLVCDPVCGLVQVPCFARNIAGTAVAAACASSALAGFDAVLPLSEVCSAAVRTGAKITAALGRECGCRDTASARRCQAAMTRAERH